MASSKVDTKKCELLKDMANKLRVACINCTNTAKSGHPTSCSSMAEIVSVLFFHVMRYNRLTPKSIYDDRFVLSKGHAAPILYSVWTELGVVSKEELMSLRKFGSLFEGHPTPKLPFVDVATGSLGQGIGNACGMAYTSKYFDKLNYRVYCVLGDGECAEGSVWEAFAFAAHYRLDNLVAIIDVNRLGQTSQTMFGHSVDLYKARLTSFGWNAIVVDGHDVSQLINSFDVAERTKDMPTCIIAKTFKGKFFPGIENELNWHGKAIGDKAIPTIESIQGSCRGDMATLSPLLSYLSSSESKKGWNVALCLEKKFALSSPPNYPLDKNVATRFAYGNALVNIGKEDTRIVVLDSEVQNSTFSETFQKVFPERFIQCYIAEQNMVAVGVGCSTRYRTKPFMSTFATFFTRAFDHIRMAAISLANISFVGSHCGVSIGEDGPSQMGLEDIALFRTIPSSLVLYPSDAVSTERAVELCANFNGISYIRTSRPATPILYSATEDFGIGKCKVLQNVVDGDADVTIIAAGITLHESLKAIDQLKRDNVKTILIDLFSVKPLDQNTIIQCAKRSKGRVVTIEDHYLEGGIGEAVCSCLSAIRDVQVYSIAVNHLPTSGSPQDLIDEYGLSSNKIYDKIKSLLSTLFA